MEPSKANTVGIVKNSPSLCTTRKTLQFFRACSGFFFPQNAKDNKPNHLLLLELPYLRIKPKTQSQQGKNDTLFKVRDPQRYLPTQPVHVYEIIPPTPTPKTSSVTWQANIDWDDEFQVIHEFPVVKYCFCYLNIF